MIDLKDTENWIQVCEAEGNDLQFTKEYLEITKKLGWGARKLAAHLAMGWDPAFETLLDYFGPEDAEEDWYSGIDGEPMDVCEKIPEKLEFDAVPSIYLTKEWHRDLYRAKLATLKIPKKLLEEYVKAIMKKQENK